MTATQVPTPANYEPGAEAQESTQTTGLDIKEPKDRGAISRWVKNRPTTGLPPPTDEEVAQWIDEYYMEKYQRYLAQEAKKQKRSIANTNPA